MRKTTLVFWVSRALTLMLQSMVIAWESKCGDAHVNINAHVIMLQLLQMHIYIYAHHTTHTFARQTPTQMHCRILTITHMLFACMYSINMQLWRMFSLMPSACNLTSTYIVLYCYTNAWLNDKRWSMDGDVLCIFLGRAIARQAVSCRLRAAHSAEINAMQTVSVSCSAAGASFLFAWKFRRGASP